MRVDLHTHTFHSVDSLTNVEALVAAARRRGLDKIAVTDHNTIQGALAAYALAPELVIIGVEVQTTRGELLGYFVKDEVPAHADPLETIRRLREQGALISISHPFDPYRSGWSPADLLALAPLVDAVEGFNSRCLAAGMNERAARFARDHGLPVTAGSDAHSEREVGNGALLLPAFCSADELRGALGLATISGQRAPAWVRFYSLYARLVKHLRRLR